MSNQVHIHYLQGLLDTATRSLEDAHKRHAGQIRAVELEQDYLLAVEDSLADAVNRVAALTAAITTLEESE